MNVSYAWNSEEADFMSSHEEWRYELERQARERAFRERVSRTTETFYRRYQAQYEEMVREGYADYIPDEMARLANDLQGIRDLLTSDPAAARDISFGIGSYISAMRHLAEAAVRQFEREEAMRREQLRIQRQQQQAEAADAFYAALANIKSPITANFAQQELAEIQSHLAEMSVKDIEQAVARAVASGEKKAAAWKEETQERQAVDAAKEQLQAVRKQIQEEPIEDHTAGEALQAQLAQLEREMEEGKRSASETLKNVQDVSKKSDELLVSEQERREVVRAIIQELRTQGFSVARPTLESGGFVKLVAQRASGERAECHIDAHGKMQYRFDHYPHMACMKDIQKFHVDLSKAYGIKFSDERVIWRNPDRRYADAYSSSTPDQQGGHA